MWYSHKRESQVLIDFSYVDLLFDNKKEANEFIKIFIKELEVAKANFHTAITKRDTHLFRQTYHNVSPHLEILKINSLSMLLQQVRSKILDSKQPFEDKELLLATMANSFDSVIKEMNNKLLQNS